MSEVAKTETGSKPEPAAPPASQPVIHRVCISCNNMFTVTLDHYEEKHCPACHKA